MELKAREHFPINCNVTSNLHFKIADESTSTSWTFVQISFPTAAPRPQKAIQETLSVDPEHAGLPVHQKTPASVVSPEEWSAGPGVSSQGGVMGNAVADDQVCMWHYPSVMREYQRQQTASTLWYVCNQIQIWRNSLRSKYFAFQAWADFALVC